MKIRILGNAIRLRLSQTEVKTLAEKGKVSEETYFPILTSDVLRYSVEKNIGEGISGRFEDGHIRIYANEKMVDDWAKSDQISMEDRINHSSGHITYLIEKDFKCLTERSEDESDLFPNPAENC